MMPAAVMAATDTDPIARCSTAAMNHASRMLTSTGAPTSAEKRPASTSSRFGLADHRAQRAADASDQQDLASGVEALVHRLAGALEPCRGAEDQIGTQEADEERKVGVAEERDEGVGELEELREGAEGDHEQGHQDR